MLANVVDDPPHCAFIAPSIVRPRRPRHRHLDRRQGASAGGAAAPAARAYYRRRVCALLELAGALREQLAAQHPDFAQRKAIWYELVDSDVLDLLRAGDDVAARQRIDEIIAQPGGQR